MNICVFKRRVPCNNFTTLITRMFSFKLLLDKVTQVQTDISEKFADKVTDIEECNSNHDIKVWMRRSYFKMLF